MIYIFNMLKGWIKRFSSDSNSDLAEEEQYSVEIPNEEPVIDVMCNVAERDVMLEINGEAQEDDKERRQEDNNGRKQEDNNERKQEDIKEAGALHRLQAYIFGKYDLRFNVITESAEWRHLDSPEEEWKVVDVRTLNTFVLDAHAGHVSCWDRDMSRLLHSHYVKDFHPMKDYMEGLPEWDGTDRVTPLAERVSHDKLWLNCFHRWMLGLAAQWMDLDMECANALAPVIISQAQGWGKSSFCRMILPKALTSYYIDRFDVNAKSGFERKLATCSLINMDEFDRYSPAQMANLKNVMQMKTTNYRKTGSSREVTLHRTASFIATTNHREILTDESGSRRFICVEAEGPIDRTPLDHAQLYAQLRHELNEGARYWLTPSEEERLQKHNKRYYRIPPAIEVFWKCFRLPEADEKVKGLGIVDIFNRLKKKYPAIMRDITANTLAKNIVALGAQRVHSRTGNVYLVVQIE